MNILIVSQYYPPEGVTIPSEIALGLESKGHNVRVLTGFPNYPTGKIYPGYSQKWRTKELDGQVEIIRVPLVTDHSASVVRRMINYLSFALSSTTARKYANDADVIYVYATQMTPAFGPWLWNKLGGPAYVLHVQDLWPESILESSMVGESKLGKLINAVLDPWLSNVYKKAASVIGIAPTMVSTLEERGADADSMALIYNWADDLVSPQEPAYGADSTEILFAGNMGDMQDLETVIRAANLIEDIPVNVTIVGDGVARKKVTGLAEELGCTNVNFRGPVPREQMIDIYAAADFSLVTLRDLEVFRGTIPSKFQSSISHGIPVITTVQGDLRGLVEGYNLGLTAEAEDPESLAQAIRSAHTMDRDEYRELRSRTREVYLNHFSRRAGIDAVETVLSRAAFSSKDKDK